MGIDSRDFQKIGERTRPNIDGYDYRLDLDGEGVDTFSFLVLGDSGHIDKDHSVSAVHHVANRMSDEPDVDFILHLGDVVYVDGSKENYPARFIQPYRHWIEDRPNLRYNNMRFNKPFLPILGNHDYYDLSGFGLLGDLVEALGLVDDFGSGSKNGRVFEEAFIETEPQDRIQNGALPYADRTRIPNRYYWFKFGNCAFIALDSNTLDATEPLTGQEREIIKLRREMVKEEAKSLEKKIELIKDAYDEGVLGREAAWIEAEPLLDEFAEKEKEKAVLKKALDTQGRNHDTEQLEWLERVLGSIDDGMFTIVYMHHPLYSSEASHTDDPESDGLQKNLRSIFVENNVNLVMSGHSHCFEWACSRRVDEENICYLVSGGGGKDLRSSILEEAAPDISQNPDDSPELRKRLWFRQRARSNAYSAIGHGDVSLHHFLRIDVSADVLKIHPVGVDASGNAYSPMSVKVMNADTHVLDILKNLESITVERGQSPRGNFI